MRKIKGFKFIALGFTVFAGALAAFGWYKAVSGLPNVIPMPNNRAAFLQSSFDQTKIYVGGLHVFDTATNKIVVSENYNNPGWHRTSRLGNFIWVEDQGGTVLRKLNGSTLQVLQTISISPPLQSPMGNWSIDWNEQFLYVITGEFAEVPAHKFSLLNGQLLATSPEPLFNRPFSIPGTQYLWLIEGQRRDPNPYNYNFPPNTPDPMIMQAYRKGVALQAIDPLTLEKIDGVFFGMNNEAYGAYAETPATVYPSPDGQRVYIVGTRDIGPPPDQYGIEPHPDWHKYSGVTCVSTSTEEVIWKLNRDDGFQGVNGSAAMDLSGRLLVVVAGYKEHDFESVEGFENSGNAHFINTLTKQFVTLQVGTEEDSDVVVCTPKRTVYFSLPSQNALLEYPIPPGFLP